MDEFIEEAQRILLEFNERVEKIFNIHREGCENPPEWIIYDKEPYIYTYSCTAHLSDMVSIDTQVIHPYKAVDIHAEQKTCCYIQ